MGDNFRNQSDFRKLIVRTSKIWKWGKEEMGESVSMPKLLRIYKEFILSQVSESKYKDNHFKNIKRHLINYNRKWWLYLGNEAKWGRRDNFSDISFYWLFLLYTRVKFCMTYSTTWQTDKTRGILHSHLTVLVKVMNKTLNENWFYLLYENVR